MNKISEKKVKEIIKDLEKYQSLNNKKHQARYYYQAKNNIVNSETLPTELIKEFLDIYSSLKKNVSTEEVETDDRAVTEVERDECGKIQYYKFEIFRKGHPVLRGKLDRKEMETIYRLYSTFGANLTGKVVSREFPQYSFIEFKRILRAFNIYKHDYLPKHLLEEMTEEEIKARHEQEKEANIMRSIEKDELSQYKKLVNKLGSKLQTYESKLGIAKTLLGYEINTNTTNSIVNTFSSNKTLVILLSDCHVGAFNEPNGYLKLETYDQTEIYRRLSKILTSLDFRNYENVVVLNLGDSVDSYNKETTRGGHELPTIISNKEQSKLYLTVMFNFFSELRKLNHFITYYCIGESNHDGDWGWLNNIVLAERLKGIGIDSYVSDNPIDYLNIESTSLIYLHGKNNVNQFKSFPLTLNKQTESWFNDFFVDCDFDLRKNKIVIKGDLHQFAVTEGHNFQYISAPSLYGSSQYIVSNFGKTNWGVAYLEIGKNINIGKISD